MSLHRFFLTTSVPAEPGSVASVPLSADDLHHARDVLRVVPGESIEAVEPDGMLAVVRVESWEDDALVGIVLSRAPLTPEPRIVLVQGVAKGEKMDAIVRQAVEVGACRIVPVLFERCVVKLDARKRTERVARWSRIAEAAAKQAHRSDVPGVVEPLGPRELAVELRDCARRVVFWEDEHVTSLADALSGVSAADEVALIVGPEGGLTAEEVSVMVAEGAVTASLGPNILRTETAAIVATALTAEALRGRE